MITNDAVKNPNELSPRTRWILHAGILSLPILLSIFLFSVGHEGKLPRTGAKLVEFVLVELLGWGLVFAVAFRVSRITAAQLFLSVKHPLRVLAYGFGWFLLIRIGSLLILFPELRWIHSRTIWTGTERIFSMLDAHGIVQHPAFSLMVFGITALIAGFSEELWRVGMLRGLQGIYPQLQGKTGTFICIVIVAVIFGLAHLYLGWLGVENAFLLGIFLGLIMIYRRSYWEAAIAHALFDAFSFAAVTIAVFNPQILSPGIISGAAKGDIPQIAHLLKLGGDVNGTFGAGRINALEMAVQHSNTQVVSYLLDNGADPNKTDG